MRLDGASAQVVTLLQRRWEVTTLLQGCWEVTTLLRRKQKGDTRLLSVRRIINSQQRCYRYISLLVFLPTVLRMFTLAAPNSHRDHKSVKGRQPKKHRNRKMNAGGSSGVFQPLVLRPELCSCAYFKHVFVCCLFLLTPKAGCVQSPKNLPRR